MRYEIRSVSAEETKTWGARLAKVLAAGSIIGLDGDLGAGKTCFVKGVAAGLGIPEDEITSPTFTLIAEHYAGRLPLYHIDLYRLEGGDYTEIGIEEYLFGKGICAIEWFQFLSPVVVTEYVHIDFAVVTDDIRLLTLTVYGAVQTQAVQTLLTEYELRDKV